MSSLTDRARGRWRSMLQMLGVDGKALRGKHGPCPMCGGKDRFRFDDQMGRGTWICTHCGAGDGFKLLMQLRGWDFKAAAEHVEQIVGKAPVEMQRRDERTDDDRRAAMNRLWSSGVPVKYGDPVSTYLERRGIKLESFPACLRYVERCRYQTGEGEPAKWYPAMVAMVSGPDGHPATLHRTYLSDGGKAPVDAPRRLMPSKLPKGCAVRLAPQAPVLGIAEGIETALSAGILHGTATWAAVNAGMLMAWEPPQGTRGVVVYADNDRSFAGQSAAYALAHRLKASGMPTMVKLPRITGNDWNDVLKVA